MAKSETKVVNQTNVSGSFLLFLVFLVLKLTGFIGWSWWWVTAPLWAPLVIAAAILGVAGLVLLVIWIVKEASK